MAGNINNSFFAQFQKARSDMKAEFNQFKQQISGTGNTQQTDGQNTAILGNRQEANAEFANNLRNAKWEQMDAQIMQMPDMMQDVHETKSGEQTVTLQSTGTASETGSVPPQVAPQPAPSTLTLEDGTVIQAKVFSDDNPT